MPRQQVDQQRIERFLQQLGRQFTKPGRVYLVGGTSVVYEGLRQQTLDIDLTFEVANEDHGLFIETVRHLKERLSLNLEMSRLTQLFNEILPNFGRTSLKQDPVEFEHKFEALTQIWLNTQGDISA